MVETERLLIRPLTYDQLLLYKKGDHSLERELGIEDSLFIISPELLEALDETILPNVANTNRNYLFSTLWTLISKDENKMVGDLCFLGEPDEEGQIEIGYGTYPSAQKKGYMTEAVAGIILWAKDQPHVRSVIASTAKDNEPSSAVLVKNHFLRIGETELMYKWRKKIK
jgi:RimJ/RimL family protein N-acetyltransferase